MSVASPAKCLQIVQFMGSGNCLCQELAQPLLMVNNQLIRRLATDTAAIVSIQS